ncbi:hypothetical protein JHK84_055611 [Glycine max]|nr:hypothetical protein JHK85_056578 [Glycine max]KAG5074380.1 hypothetical protein JHK84_055611 [Glycine max]
MLTKPSVFGVLGFSERSTLDYPYLHGNRPPISDISLSGLCGQLLTWYSPLPLEKKLGLRWEGKEQVETTRKVGLPNFFEGICSIMVAPTPFSDDRYV